MTRRLDDSLRDAVPPDAAAARERSRFVVLSAHAERPAEAPRVRRRHAAAPAVAVFVLAMGAGAVAAAPPADGVRAWVRDVVGVSTSPPPPPAPALDRLPAAGRLLVSGPGGTWVVARDGSRRRLGPYSAATWSPWGRFVGAVRGRQLVAVSSGGTVRWTLAAAAPVRDPRWSTTGFRIAYRAGKALRVVAGDGSGDRLVATAVAPVAPAWRPAGARHELTYLDTAGHVVRVDTDRRRVRTRRRPTALGGRPDVLQWSASGQRLLVAGRVQAQVLTPRGAVVRRIAAPTGTTFSAAALAPDGRHVALVASAPSGRRAVLVAGPAGQPRTLFAAAGDVAAVTWSPDGRFVVASWTGADQWLFLGARRGARTTAVAGVAMQFDIGRNEPRGAPTIEGWCCGKPIRAPSRPAAPG